MRERWLLPLLGWMTGRKREVGVTCLLVCIYILLLHYNYSVFLIDWT